MKKTAPAGVRAVDMGPLRELRTKRPRHADLRTRKRPRHADLRMEKDRASWSETGRYGSF